MSSIAARRANKRVCPLQPNGILSRGTHGILAQMRVDLPPLVDDPTADAEYVLGVVPLAFDHLEIRELDIGVYPRPLGLHGTGDLCDSPDEHPIREPDQLSKGPWYGCQRPLLVVQPIASNQTTTAAPMRCRMICLMRHPPCRESSHWMGRRRRAQDTGVVAWGLP